ncbi:twin-arginine translocation pathway signal [Bradyrhizobium lablabi]|uniref:twin-arginine translocation pathway signal n=1 Tax=Bradyrhizobium lablabi TaxID=722472 RepID=UPI001BA7D414|nr:twin-arginine translocation pathway signal [Bradyrhizobium lablabi]MBR0697863.1 twin-arginine translocation pathway signal [Bradyrhizobium lablabi]
MSVRCTRRRSLSRAAAVAVLLALAAAVSACAQIGDSVAPAFADPAKYDLYECKQLEAERKTLTARAAELQGLMAKAETGVGGAVVAEVAYRNDLISVRAQQKLVEEVWARNKCHETPPDTAAAAPPAASAKGTRPSRSGIR